MPETIQYDTENSFGILLGWAAQLMTLELNRKFTEAGHDATVEQWKILITLWAEDGLTQQELAKRTHKNKVSVVKLIDGLERRELVRRQPDPKDRRGKRIQLTPKGHALEEDLIRLANHNLERAEAGIDRQDMAVCKKVLRHIIENMKDSVHGDA